MVIVLKQNPDGNKVEQLMKRLRGMGLDIHQSQGKSSTILGLVGDTSSVDIDALNALEIVETVKRIQEPYKSANRKFHPEDSVIRSGPALKLAVVILQSSRDPARWNPASSCAVWQPT